MRFTGQAEKRPKIGVIYPSRGTTFSKTVEEMLAALEGYDHQIFFSHGRPIPDCFEIPTREILAGNFTHMLTLEDDMIIPKNCITDMLATGKPAVAYDYPIAKKPSGTVIYDKNNEAFFTGCGILLVEIALLKRMKLPIWRSDISWGFTIKNEYVEFEAKESAKDVYGHQDISFGLRLYYNNVPIHVMEETVGQRKIAEYGKKNTNNGSHIIEEWTDTKKIKFKPSKERDYIKTIILPDGSEVNMFYTSADRLVAEGKARDPLVRNALFKGLYKLGDWITLKD